MLHGLAGWSKPCFGAGAGVGGVRGLLVYSLRLECVFLQLRSTSLVVASRRRVWWRGEVRRGGGGRRRLVGVAAHSMFVGFRSDLELLRWWVLAVRVVGLPGSTVVLVKGVPKGRFWGEVVGHLMLLG